jgi:RNA polymerase I-specific transcription initiation factor RRN6
LITDVVVFLKSSLSPLATSFRFTPDESSPQFLRVADATKLVLPELPTTASALTFRVQPAEYGGSVHHEQPSGPGKIYRDLFIRFFVATAITSDMAVVQKLYYASPNTMTESSLPEVTPPDWRGRLVQSYPRLRESDFIEQSLVNQGQVNTREEQDGILSPHIDSLKSTRDDWTMLYELSHARATGAASKTEDFSRIISRTEQALQAPDPADGGHKLLSELFDEQILVPDIDQAAAEFNDMISSKTSHGESMDEVDQMLQLARVGYSTLDLGPNSDMDLMDVYDNIMAHWLTPLSQTVPGRVRLVKEQLARRIAAGICLSSHVLRQPVVKPSEETMPDTQATEDAFSFPQSSLPTPSPTATPSMTTVTSLSSHPSTLVSSEFARLQRYTTFSTEKATPAPLPKGLTNTLAHWSLGSNPDKYDWLAVQREQEKRAEEEDEDLTPKERARLKRRAEKLLLKQRREAQKASAMDLANSQVPGIVSASQPAFMNTPSRGEAVPVPHSARAASQGTQLLASSQAPPNMFTSQIQPGKFGGKPAKKKRRVVGF